MRIPKARPTSIVPLRGGLGNQLFCWAYGRALEEQGHRVFFDSSPSLGRGYALEGLILDAQLIKLDRRFRSALMSKTAQWIPGFSIIRERQDLPPNMPTKQQIGGAIHWGYWQSQDYFRPIAAELRHDLRLWMNLQKSAVGEYCAVHVRRGDYVTDPGAASTLGVLPVAYYEEAITHMRDRGVENFVVYTDDRGWASENLVSSSQATALSPAGTALDDFRGIAHATAVITANSSFSWWATFMGDRPDRPVVSPLAWFADASPCNSAIAPDSWARI